MLVLLSPAKTLDFESELPALTPTTPPFLEQSAELIAHLRKFSAAEIAQLMNLSPALSQLNEERYQQWQVEHTTENSRPAGLAFKGDVYLGLQAERFSAEEMMRAQGQIRILSGLYGVLKPLDTIQPYRLEMGTKLANEKGKDLYAFWKETVTASLRAELESHAEKVMINLASKEYSKTVNLKVFPQVITPVFKDYKEGKYKIISFFAKKARGQMAALIVKNNLKQAEALQTLDVDGYVYHESLSRANEWVFARG